MHTTNIRPARGRTATRVSALLISLMCATGCATVIDGHPHPEPRPGPSASPGDASNAYQPPPDGSGFSTAPLDQPNPVPSIKWHGWTDACAWIQPDLATTIGATGPGQPSAIGCTLPLGTDAVQIAWTFPFAALHTPTHFSRPATVAGLQARQYALTGQGPRECTMQINPRSATTLHLVIWDPTNPDSGDRETRCATAAQIADTIVTRLVPLAGGTPWPGTPQRPTEAQLADATACSLVNATVAALSNLDRTDGTPGTANSADLEGTTCQHRSDHAQADILLVHAGLAAVPNQLGDATSSPQQIVGLPARLERSPVPVPVPSTGQQPTCAAAVELSPHVTLQAAYRLTGTDHNVSASAALGEIACKFTEVLVATVVGALLDHA